MFRVQCRRLHRTGLALAALALSATVLTASSASTAAAAPAERLSPAAGSDVVMVDPIVNLPIANVAVSNKSKTGDPYVGQEYTFEVKNFGPAAASVKLRREFTRFYPDGSFTHHPAETTESFGVGETRLVTVKCILGSGAHYCFAGSVTATVVGLDPNDSNNSAVYHNPLP